MKLDLTRYEWLLAAPAALFLLGAVRSVIGVPQADLAVPQGFRAAETGAVTRVAVTLHDPLRMSAPRTGNAIVLPAMQLARWSAARQASAWRQMGSMSVRSHAGGGARDEANGIMSFYEDSGGFYRRDAVRDADWGWLAADVFARQDERRERVAASRLWEEEDTERRDSWMATDYDGLDRLRDDDNAARFPWHEREERELSYGSWKRPEVGSRLEKWTPSGLRR